ncbi:MAG: class I SAM-dependent methyltransferase [Pirellulales bacterium]
MARQLGPRSRVLSAPRFGLDRQIRARCATSASRRRVRLGARHLARTADRRRRAAADRPRLGRRRCRATPGRASVADVGCGSGRFLKPIAERYPRLQLTGIDPSAALLGALPESAAAVPGQMLHLPTADDTFDAAFCIEALEHALAPRRAVAELCRIVRPAAAW